MDSKIYCRFCQIGKIKFTTAQDYPGNSWNVTDSHSGRDQMLSRTRLDHYQVFYNQFVTTVLSYGMHYKFDEAGSFYKGGAKGAGNIFASALWALDFMHWWTKHDCSGIYFHNNRWFMYNITI